MKRVKLLLRDENVLFPFGARCVVCGERVSAFRTVCCNVM